MTIGEFSVKQPVLVNLIFIAVIVVGLYTYSSMPAELLPNVNMDEVVVVVVYPGVSPEEMETLVTKPLEEEIEGVEDVDYVSSTSGESRAVIDNAASALGSLLNADPGALIWTSGATESDNLAIVGGARYRQHRGKHLVIVVGILGVAQGRVGYLGISEQPVEDPAHERLAVAVARDRLEREKKGNENG